MEKRKAAKRRRFLVVLLVMSFIATVFGLNKLLMDFQLRSLRASEKMVWYNGERVAESVAEELSKKTVVLPIVEPVETPLPERTYERSEKAIEVTDEEYLLLLKIGMAEGAGEPIEGVRAIYTVIFNRIEDNHLGENTIKGTIFKPYQFSGVGKGQWFTEPSDKVKMALDDVLNGYRSFEKEILWYLYPEGSTDREQVARLVVRYTIGHHVFGVMKK